MPMPSFIIGQPLSFMAFMCSFMASWRFLKSRIFMIRWISAWCFSMWACMPIDSLMADEVDALGATTDADADAAG